MDIQRYKKFVQRGTLLVPEQLANSRNRRSRIAAIFDHTLVCAGYNEFFDGSSSFEAIKECLEPFSLEEIIDALSRVSTVLNEAESPRNPDAQKFLCLLFFGNKDGEELWQNIKKREIEDEKKDGIEKTFIPFNERQLLSLARIAFQIKSVSKDTDLERKPLYGIGKALLMATDLFDGPPGDDTGNVLFEEETQRRWLNYFLANSFFHHEANLAQVFARSKLLYLTDRSHLRSDGNYLDLPKLFRRTTGLEPRDFWSMLFALFGYWRNLDLEPIKNSDKWINLNSYFTEGFNISSKKIESFKNLISVSAKQMKEMIQANYSDELHANDVFNFLPFGKRPLISFNNRTYCLSKKLLSKKLGMGLHHVFTEHPDESTRGRFLKYMGPVFADYVSEIFKRIYSDRYIDLDNYREVFDDKYCDGIIFYDNALILIETKANRLNLLARKDSDVKKVENKIMDDIFVKGSKQIQSTIDAIEDGRLEEHGIDSNKDWIYYPVLVTLEKLSMNRALYQIIEKQIENENVLRKQRIKPFQLFTVDEMECIKNAMEEGYTLRCLIDDKIKDDRYKEQSFMNFWHHDEKEFLFCKNTYLNEVLEESGDEAKEYFESRKKPDTETG